MDTGKPDVPRLGAEQVEAVLRRAAELDSLRGSALTIDELRSVAAEAGISGSSFDAAISELDSQRTEEPAVRMPWPVTAATATASVTYVLWWARAIAADGVVTSDVVGLVAGTAVVAATMFGFSAFALGMAKKVKRHVRAYVNGPGSA